eukprot:TRINITY_DN4442_c0_g1_i1.p1 TRINITY_DN4442_c0_g1~~TRINITY_DN4442_c0_g1_i1.p1  ORF type:complete len:396 (-),score=94.58 TRINITY_DN4442_c0_g1_i1:69-1256(-)
MGERSGNGDKRHHLHAGGHARRARFPSALSCSPYAEIKFRALSAYNWILTERRRRRDFILANNLLEYKKLQIAERKRCSDKELCQAAHAFLQFMPRDVYEDFLSSLVVNMELVRRLTALKHLRAQGISTFADADCYESERRKQNGEKKSGGAVGAGAKLMRDSFLAFPALPQNSPGAVAPTWHRSGKKGGKKAADAAAAAAAVAAAAAAAAGCLSATPAVLAAAAGAGSVSSLLSDVERQLCAMLRLQPAQYVAFKEACIYDAHAAKVGRGVGRAPTAAMVHRARGKLDPSAASYLTDFFESAGWLAAADLPPLPPTDDEDLHMDEDDSSCAGAALTAVADECLLLGVAGDPKGLWSSEAIAITDSPVIPAVSRRNSGGKSKRGTGRSSSAKGFH